jgi:hypothetical protein
MNPKNDKGEISSKKRSICSFKNDRVVKAYEK